MLGSSLVCALPSHLTFLVSAMNALKMQQSSDNPALVQPSIIQCQNVLKETGHKVYLDFLLPKPDIRP